MSERKIIHVDMDAFYAAVEQRDNPELKGKPVVVGGSDPTRRGVVSTASYEARKFGVHSAMPLREAYRRCPEGIYLPVNMSKYRRVSQQIFDIFLEYTPLVENISLDEAFLDVTGSQRLFGSAEKIGREIKERIRKEVNLTASIGISYNKFLAKLASDLEKPDGFVVIDRSNFKRLVHPLPVKRLWGVGSRMEEKLHALGLRTIGDVAQASPLYLKKQFGVAGEQIYMLSQGIDGRPVVPEREAKSVGRETTFPDDVVDEEVLLATLMQLVEDVGFRLRRNKCWGRCVTVKVRYAGFETHTRQAQLLRQTNLETEIYTEAKKLFTHLYDGRPVRLLGVTVSQLTFSEEQQLEFFEQERQKEQALAEVTDLLRQKYGRPLVMRARGLERKE